VKCRFTPVRRYCDNIPSITRLNAVLSSSWLMGCGLLRRINRDPPAIVMIDPGFGTFAPTSGARRERTLGVMETTISPTGVRRRIVIASAALLLGCAVLLGVLLSRGSSPASGSTQLASIRSGCEQWLSTTSQRVSDQPCVSMIDWMSQDMKQFGTGPQMMLGTADDMLTTCEQWMSGNPQGGSVVTRQQWCNAMVTWMTSHMGRWAGHGDWGNWTMNGSMMGNT